MRVKLLVLGSALALLAAACGSEAPSTEARFGVVNHGDAALLQVLAYDYEPASSLEYGFIMDMDMNMAMDFPGMGDSGDMSMGMSMGGDIAYDVAAGPQPGSTELTMRSSLRDFDLEHFTVGGRSMAGQLGAADLAELQSQSALPEMSVVVGANGEILEMRYGDAAMPTEMLNSFGAGGFSDPTGMSLAGLFGPELPSEAIGVGAEWIVDTSEEVPFVGMIESSTHHWITAQQEFNGRDVLVIVSATEIEDVEMDLMEMMESMLEMDSASAAAMGINPADLAGLTSELFDGMEMTMRFSYDDLASTTYFDPANGTVVWTSTEALMSGSMDMVAPDGSGSMTFGMRMDMEMIAADGLGT
ncbi:MAG: hypothetical protein KJP22_07880 [Acidimicrobiia bacterium]|nr:hypothetical protein [Acidimicrobiia bacterium]